MSVYPLWKYTSLLPTGHKLDICEILRSVSYAGGAGEPPQYTDVQVSMTSQDVTLVIDLVHSHCGVSPRLFDEQDVLVSALVTGRDRI